MISNQTRRAALMITNLSDMLRSVLVGRTSNLLSLREEIDLTKQYLSIQQIRFENSLTIEYDIASNSLDCPVPQLILQPIVENAIIHGIGDVVSKALIRITSKRWADSIVIEVFDNGVGRNQIHNRSGTGLGLANTRSRLEKLYGSRAQLRFEQPVGGTTTVKLLIPFHSSLPTTLRQR